MVKQTTDPVWDDEKFSVPVKPDEEAELLLEIHDKDPFDDDFIGEIRISGSKLLEIATGEMQEFPLTTGQGARKSKFDITASRLRICVRSQHMQASLEQEPGQMPPVDHLRARLLVPPPMPIWLQEVQEREQRFERGE